MTSDPLNAANQEFDYVIIGGGLSGLTVASRLSEDPSVTVLVIEAGGDDRDDPRVWDVVYSYSKAFGTKLDWNFTTDNNRGMDSYVYSLHEIDP